MLVNKIANKIKEQYPTLNDLSKRNLYQLIQFYEIYKDNKKVQTLSAQLGMINFTVMIQSHYFYWFKVELYSILW